MVHLEQRSLYYMGFWVFHLILAGWTGDFSAGNGRQYYHSHIVLPKSIISLKEIKTKWNLIKVSLLMDWLGNHLATLTQWRQIASLQNAIYINLYDYISGSFRIGGMTKVCRQTYSKNQRLATHRGKAMEEMLQVVFLSCTKTFKVSKHLRLVNDSHLTRVTGRAESL